MPKDRKVNSLSFNGARGSPYACSSKNSELELKSSLPPVGNEREWEKARCPICMDHPHNAVLLLCSSREKGCLPYMCDTSYRHSNCLDQFCKLSSGTQSGAQQEGSTISGRMLHRGSQGQTTWSTGGQQHELVCPLCRGQIKGRIVVEAARKFMNSKQRCCSLETCNVNGNYGELRKHARLEHPSDRPAMADPGRQCDWRRMELERDMGDTFSAYQTPFGDDFLSELPLDDDDLFDFLDGYSEAEDGLSEDNVLIMGFDFELSFTFLNDFPFLPVESHDLSNSDDEMSATRSRANTGPENRRPRRSTSSDNDEERPSRRESIRPSRHMHRRPRRSTSSDNDEERPARRESIMPSRHMHRRPRRSTSSDNDEELPARRESIRRPRRSTSSDNDEEQPARRESIRPSRHMHRRPRRSTSSDNDEERPARRESIRPSQHIPGSFRH